jgi:hypothetical protein
MSDESAAAAADRTARSSTLLGWATRVGLVGYGFVHLLIAWVAIRVAVGARGSATGSGALAQLSHDPLGLTTLGSLTVAFAALAVWQAIAAAVGYRELSGRNRHLMRLGAVCRMVVYAYFALASASLFLHPSSSGRGRSGRGLTASLLTRPAGTAVLALAALTVSCIGVGLIVFGARRQFMGQLDDAARTGDRRIPIALVGQIGYVVKGAAFLVVGILLGVVTVTDNPRRTGGLDQSFRSLLGQTIGRPAVIVAGLGIGLFGIYLFVRARHLNPRRLTS